MRLEKSELEQLGLETSRLKFVRSKETGELISFVYRQSLSKELKGVPENFERGKQICVLSKELKEAGIIREKTLYWVELRAMHGGKKGFVVVHAEPILFPATIETTLISKVIYRVCVTFGNKTVRFDPKDGRSPTRCTLEGALHELEGRVDIEDKEAVIEDFKAQASIVIRQLVADGYTYPRYR